MRNYTIPTLFLQRSIETSRLTPDTSARYSGCLAWASLPGSGRRYHRARVPAALASSLYFLASSAESVG